MKSTSYAVHQSVHQPKVVDGMAESGRIGAVPKSIKAEMPVLAGVLQDLEAGMGAQFVAGLVRTAMEIRRAFDADDFRAVSAVYARRAGWINASEGGYQLGVPEADMRAFAARHRKARAWN